jgi:transcriptional regulator with XRE-family HTH domain
MAILASIGVTRERYSSQEGSQLRREWASRLRELREWNGLSRHELAVKAGVTATTIWRIEKGEHEPRTISKLRIIHALGFTDEDAFFKDFKAATGVTPTVTTSPDGTLILEATHPNWTPNAEGRLEDLRIPEAGLLPIYNWGACGDPRNSDSAPDPSDLEYPPIGKERLVGMHGFAIRVRGSSMTNRKIHDGDIVWVNPDMAPRIGRIVAARTWNLDGGECGTVIKVWRKNEEGGDELWGDGEDEEGRDHIIFGRMDILGPIVWISPQGYPPE